MGNLSGFYYSYDLISTSCRYQSPDRSFLYWKGVEVGCVRYGQSVTKTGEKYDREELSM